MSLDVHIGDFDRNYTHNVNGMWNRALLMANNRRKLAGKKPLTPDGWTFYDFLYGGETSVLDPDIAPSDALGRFWIASRLPKQPTPPRAKRVAPVLRAMAFEMRLWPDAYRCLDPGNRWGDYEGALGFIEAFAEACEIAHPDERIGVSA